MLWICIFLVIFHIICCILCFLGIAAGALKVHKYMFWIVVFLPIWGIITVLILDARDILKRDGRHEVEVEKLKVESEIYKGITVEDNKNSKKIVPMEEALIVNTPSERRTLIMDILNDNPKEYVEFLQKAGNNDDTEVVHYAVTAMVEISKENDHIQQRLENKYNKEPDNPTVISDYCDFLWNSLSSNLMQGQVETVNRNLFSELIQKKLEHSPSIADYKKMVQNFFALKNFTEAGNVISTIEKLYPQNEEVWHLKIDYLSCMGRGEDIKKFIEETENSGMYLSSAMKGVISFWAN